MFKNVIVKKPCKNIVKGITAANLGKPDYAKALIQHEQYIEALRKCQVEVIVLEADENFPDSTFVEDAAVLTEKCAVITNPGAKSRKGEEKAIQSALKSFYINFEFIEAPGTLDGGDVMRVENHFYIGLSNRTNYKGSTQFVQILDKYGYTGSIVPFKDLLHLKTGVSYLEDNNLLATGEFINFPLFQDFNIITVDEAEAYAANCIRVNDYVIVPQGFNKTKNAIERTGYKTIPVDVSEFRKLDGGLSCLSLRF